MFDITTPALHSGALKWLPSQFPSRFSEVWRSTDAVTTEPCLSVTFHSQGAPSPSVSSAQLAAPTKFRQRHSGCCMRNSGWHRGIRTGSQSHPLSASGNAYYRFLDHCCGLDNLYPVGLHSILPCMQGYQMTINDQFGMIIICYKVRDLFSLW